MKYNEVWKDSFEERLLQFQSPEEAINGASAILIITEWNLFK
jgi:hypothetical protein